jgi:hypothetical protein
MIEILGRRGGILSSEGFHMEVRGGVGRTARLDRSLFVYGLITLGAVTDCCDRGAITPGIETGIVWLAGNRLRLGGRFGREHDIAGWARSVERSQIWARYDLASDWGVTVWGEALPRGSAIRISWDWYP